MKQLMVLAIMMLSGTIAFAQMPAAGMKQGAGSMSIRLFGKLTDNEGKPVSQATVLLMQTKTDSATKKPKQVLYKTGLSQANGDFSFEDLSLKDRYTLKISSVGYKPYDLPVNFFAKNADGSTPAPSLEKDLGKIKLTADAQSLQAVTVTASAPGIKLNADKKIFNVEKNIMSAGGTG